MLGEGCDTEGVQLEREVFCGLRCFGLVSLEEEDGEGELRRLPRKR